MVYSTGQAVMQGGMCRIDRGSPRPDKCHALAGEGAYPCKSITNGPGLACFPGQGGFPAETDLFEDYTGIRSAAYRCAVDQTPCREW